MRECLSVANALADRNRVRMLLSLQAGELCVCQITEFSELAPSTVSKHMSILREAGLVEGRKAGRWMYYRVAGPGASPIARAAIGWVQSSLAADPRVAEDTERIVDILKKDRAKQCPAEDETQASRLSKLETVDGSGR